MDSSLPDRKNNLQKWANFLAFALKGLDGQGENGLDDK
jgi:hypothetical protein